VRAQIVALEGVSVVVVGLARSGVAAAEFLARRGARVVATDLKTEGELSAEALRLRALGVRLELGAHRRETFAAASMVVVSPGVPWERAELQAARASGAEVMAEVELAFRHLRGRLAAVTGTKGKSTTTAALGAVLREAGLDVRVGGNIGAPLVGLVEGSTDATVFAVEVSSFQLEGTDRFHPEVAVWLNLSPDHLDRHPSLDAYVAAKARIFARQEETDWAVVNADDPVVLEQARRARARLLPLRVDGSPPPDADAAFFRGGGAWMRRDGREERLFDLADVRLPGRHLAGDILAAAAAARLLGATGDDVVRAVRGFRGVEHVLEHVATIGGVAFYDDSKATNVAAATRSIEAFDGRVLVILGGRYKGGDFSLLALPLRARGARVLAIGEARERVRSALSAEVPVEECGSLGEAVARAHALAEPGDTVLLAPGCSSFDMFRDYAERGRRFKEEVRRLAQRSKPTGHAKPPRKQEREG
jgi:UDP-N-acetylmuramoylalanine--D-glutamate ligase